MSGNTFGNLFKVMTFGESHGQYMGVVIDGLKPGIKIEKKEIQELVNKRKPGTSNIVSARKEKDKIKIISGIFNGKTTGTPVCILVKNTDKKSGDYKNLMNLFRPGHAGFTYLKKYSIYDYRGGGRASGRETLSRVIAGSIAKILLKDEKIKVTAYTKSIGKINISKYSEEEIKNNSLFCPDKVAANRMIKLIRQVQKKGDSVGGIIEIKIENLAPGYGEPVFEKLEAEFAKALMSIGSVKGFEVGNGFESSKLMGSENNDEFYLNKSTGEIITKTNRSGGILGGISNGLPIILRIAIKPTSSIKKKQHTVSYSGKEETIEVLGRHDPCICPRIVPVAEAMVWLVLADMLLLQKRITKKITDEANFKNDIKLIDLHLMLLRKERKQLITALSNKKVYSKKEIKDLSKLLKLLNFSDDEIRDIFIDLNQ